MEKRKEIDWVVPMIIAAVALMFYVFALYTLSEVKKERDRLANSYKAHLVVERLIKECGVSFKSPLTPEQERCSDNLHQKTEAQLKLIKDGKTDVVPYP